jgi:hypothetical protein
MIGDAQQYEELTRLYSTFGDLELQALAGDMDELTDAAQSVLKAELARRGLDVSERSEVTADSAPDDFAESPLHAFAAMAPAECVFEFAELAVAVAARSALFAAGIESVIPGRAPGSLSAPRVVVAPQDAMNAALVLSQPLESDADGLADKSVDFVESSCPHCGAVDPLLESVEPTNQWRCEACDHVWSDEEMPLA